MYAEDPSVPKPIGAQTKLDGAQEEVKDDSSKKAGLDNGLGNSLDDGLELSPEAREQLTKLKARDQQVRTHEAAHMAAGGSLVRGGATYTYQAGPDGQRYAVGGEVSLDASPVPNDPRATITKAERLRAAAMAPADPSGQDRAVAAQAAAMASQAAMELTKQHGTSTSGGNSIGSKLNLLG